MKNCETVNESSTTYVLMFIAEVGRFLSDLIN
jgi:hypothetical protein